MKAIVNPAPGPAQAPGCFVLEDRPAPERRPHDLLVRVEAAAINPVGTKIRPAPSASPARSSTA